MDYSKFEHPHDWDNWFGKVCIKDGAAEKMIPVEIQTEEDEIPDASKKALEFFAEHYPRYQEILLEPVLEYYDCRRGSKGNLPADDPVYPEVRDPQQLKKMYSLHSIVILDPDSNEPDSIGLVFDCTWDTEEGMAVKMAGFRVVEIGIQGTQY